LSWEKRLPAGKNSSASLFLATAVNLEAVKRLPRKERDFAQRQILLGVRFGRVRDTITLGIDVLLSRRVGSDEGQVDMGYCEDGGSIFAVSDCSPSR
jgi:hypothetical protein